VRSSRHINAGPALGFCFDQLVRRGLRGIWTRGAVPQGPFIWAANHHSWWDGFIANSVLRETGHTPAVLMDSANLAHFSFLTKSGAVAADRPRAALTSIRSGHSLVVFPEGVLRSPGSLGPLSPGAAWLAQRAHVPLIAVAARVVIRGNQFGEAYLDLSLSTVDTLASDLTVRLNILDNELAASDPRSPLGGFTQVVAGRRSWDERITAWASIGRT
jgi:1-acyl-sn-glycerol-3-phosphate acyltransferase